MGLEEAKSNTSGSAETRLEQHDELRLGEQVVIEDGPLLGLRGSLIETRSDRVVLSVKLLRTAALVELDRTSVRREARMK